METEVQSLLILFFLVLHLLNKMVFMKILKEEYKNVKASYPIGDALEDWKIFNLILKALGKKESLSNFESLRKEVLNLIPNFTKLNELPSFKECEINNLSNNYISEEVINIKELDYYFTNAISRASKTMSECRQIKYSSQKTGTNN